MTAEDTYARLLAAGDPDSLAVAHDLAEEMGWAWWRANPEFPSFVRRASAFFSDSHTSTSYACCRHGASADHSLAITTTLNRAMRGSRSRSRGVSIGRSLCTAKNAHTWCSVSRRWTR